MPVAVALEVQDSALSSRGGVGESVLEAAVGAVVYSAHEGSPGQKLGAAYVPTAGEDHTTKAHSIGELAPPAAPVHSPQPAEPVGTAVPRRDPTETGRA
jgi:hypothetical protein